MKVSIIVPVHNAETTLRRCVESIIGQEYKDIECILVENGSSDQSKKLCFEYATRYINVLAISSTESGVSNARNKGLSLATGEIVGFCDADDFIEEKAISKVVEVFENSANVGAVFGAFYIGTQNGVEIEKEYIGIKSKEVSRQKALELILIDDNVRGSVWNKYYRVNLLSNQEFDPKLSFCEDMHFNAKVLSNVTDNFMIEILDVPFYCYMDDSNSVTHQDNLLFDNNDDLKYIIAFKSILEGCHLEPKIINIVKMKIASFAIHIILNKKVTERQKNKLKKEVRENYRYLVMNIWKGTWRKNVKRAFYGLKILLIK